MGELKKQFVLDDSEVPFDMNSMARDEVYSFVWILIVLYALYRSRIL